jgi:hypothetical protein
VTIADVVALQQKIAARIHHGGSLADVRQEIIEVAALDETSATAAARRPWRMRLQAQQGCSERVLPISI